MFLRSYHSASWAHLIPSPSILLHLLTHNEFSRRQLLSLAHTCKGKWFYTCYPLLYPCSVSALCGHAEHRLNTGVFFIHREVRSSHCAHQAKEDSTNISLLLLHKTDFSCLNMMMYGKCLIWLIFILFYLERARGKSMHAYANTPMLCDHYGQS